MHRFFPKPETLLRLTRGPLGDYPDRFGVCWPSAGDPKWKFRLIPNRLLQ